MAGVKYSRVPTDDDHVVDLGTDPRPAFDYKSAFQYGGLGTGGLGTGAGGDVYKSAFTYSRTGTDKNVAIMDVEGQKSIMGSVVTPILTAVSYLVWLVTLPLSAWFTFRVIKQYERMVVFRLGKLQKVKGPGLAFTLPCIDRIRHVDVRTKAFSVPPQKAITSDGATVEMGADVYHHVTDAVKSVTCVCDFDHSVRALSQLSLSKALSTFTLQQVQSDQLTIGHHLTEQLCHTTTEWGIKISKVQLSPVKVVQEPNALLEGCNLMNAPLDWLGPLLFPPGTTQLPVKPLQERGLLPPTPLPGMPGNLDLGRAMAAMASASGLTDGGQQTNLTNNKIQGEQLAPRDLLQAVRPLLKASMVNTVKALFVFRVIGDDGGDFYLDLKHGDGDVGEGLPPGGHQPDATLTLKGRDLEKMFCGEVSAFQAYVSGRLKIDGDLQAAMSLQAIVENIQVNK